MLEGKTKVQNKDAGVKEKYPSGILRCCPGHSRQTGRLHFSVVKWLKTQKDNIMKFRPCIDIHNGKVNRLSGGSLRDQGDQAEENFAADQGADYFAEMYKKTD